MRIELKEFTIKEQKRIALLFKYDREVIELIKQIEGSKWSAIDKFWHIPYQEEAYQKLNKQFKDKLEFVKYSEVPSEYFAALEKENYNESTFKTYSNNFRKFLQYYPNLKPAEITPDQIRKYIIHLVDEKKCSPSYQNNVITAIRFYYTKVLGRELDDYYAPRPHRPKSTPKVLNEQEVAAILKHVTDLRDKCMIFLVYSAGLTPSEIIYLKPDHVDSKAMKIFISSAKGDKDRYVVLADKLLILLRKYFKQYKPKEWLFESSPGKQYSRRNLQKSFQTAVKKSGINKPATLTILKNSFAVHLIEKGVDIRYIQQILGHKQSKTTMKYLKVSKKDIKAIRSPLDSLEI
ncbi:MAG: site-specific integrase [Candidatus Cloacimonetes bacterium]|nr:site-specific integrase [Candidatus Cloacimonadota bacterium]MCF7814905.1 site-specific integrase [Candidatus Cloacimonadota bacterium]MCF7884620.1 site-specific integrase [Candidatus Cloacimonadota bacterium]